MYMKKMKIILISEIRFRHSICIPIVDVAVAIRAAGKEGRDDRGGKTPRILLWIKWFSTHKFETHEESERAADGEKLNPIYSENIKLHLQWLS